MSHADDTTAARWVRPFITVLVVAVVVIAATWWWIRSHRTGIHFSAQFVSAVGVYPGSGVRVLGVPVGQIDSVTPKGPYVVIRMHLDPGVSVRADTMAAVVSPNLVSDRYVQLAGAYDSGPKLADGALIPLTRTATPVEVDQLYKSLLQLSTALGPGGANSHGALSDFLNSSAANLNGNGADINKTISALSKASTTLSGSQKDFFSTIDNLQSFTSMLKDNDGSLQSVNTELASVSQVLADDRASFSAALSELDNALALVQGFIKDNRAALSEQVAKLAGVAKTLATEQASLAKALQVAPLLTQNFENAYDPTKNVLLGRGDLNELTIWARTGTTSSTAHAKISSNAPPLLLPGVGGGR